MPPSGSENRTYVRHFRSFKLRMYAITSSMSLGSTIRFGIDECGERDHSVNPASDAPGRLATCLNGGALLFGEGALLSDTL